jgi:hypothetical protein
MGQDGVVDRIRSNSSGRNCIAKIQYSGFVVFIENYHELAQRKTLLSDL